MTPDLPRAGRVFYMLKKIIILSCFIFAAVLVFAQSNRPHEGLCVFKPYTRMA
jgi:hypothetical protein